LGVSVGGWVGGGSWGRSARLGRYAGFGTGWGVGVGEGEGGGVTDAACGGRGGGGERWHEGASAALPKGASRAAGSYTRCTPPTPPLPSTPWRTLHRLRHTAVHPLASRVESSSWVVYQVRRVKRVNHYEPPTGFVLLSIKKSYE
jgi:hypothetical protein